MEYSLLSQINPTRHNWSIKVRVARMWQLSGTSKGQGFTAMELVLVDEEVCPFKHDSVLLSYVVVMKLSVPLHQGVGITASVGRKDLNRFADSLVEGRSYMIKKFQVSSQPRKYSAVPSTNTIFFTPWTVVEEVPTELSTNLPLYVFNFVDFEDLDHRSRNDHGLVGMH